MMKPLEDGSSPTMTFMWHVNSEGLAVTVWNPMGRRNPRLCGDGLATSAVGWDKRVLARVLRVCRNCDRSNKNSYWSVEGNHVEGAKGGARLLPMYFSI